MACKGKKKTGGSYKGTKMGKKRPMKKRGGKR